MKPISKEPSDTFIGACPFAQPPTSPKGMWSELPVAVMEFPHSDLPSGNPAAQHTAD